MFVLITILAQSFTVAAPLLETHVVTELVVLVLLHKRAITDFVACYLVLVVVYIVYNIPNVACSKRF